LTGICAGIEESEEVEEPEGELCWPCCEI
jgi:hypothetical protein